MKFKCIVEVPFQYKVKDTNIMVKAEIELRVFKSYPQS